jgi:hypothetical protein
MDQTLALYQQLRESMSQQIADRTTAHQAKIATLKTAVASRMAAGAPAPSASLVMLAHGDSWFDYPLSGNNPSIIPSHTDITVQLQSMGNVNPHILNVSQWGDATTAEMSRPRQQLMITALQEPSNWVGKPDAILFSGGGNDIAGDQFCIFLDYAPSADGLDDDRFQEALGIVQASYRDLFAFRDRYAPGVPIFGHCYDFPIPNGAHPCPNVGPWLQPSLAFCGYNDIAQGTAILRQALTTFKGLLAGLAAETDANNQPANNFFLIDTQNTLVPEDWANELHPGPAGFKKIAEKFVEALRTHFPNRI